MNNIKFTQEDAEYLAEWFNFVNSKSFGILSEEFKNKVIKADIIRGNLTQLMYENSNWRIKRKYRKGKYSKATIEYVSNKENEDVKLCVALFVRKIYFLASTDELNNVNGSCEDKFVYCDNCEDETIAILKENEND
jgi:hypothetical protein